MQSANERQTSRAPGRGRRGPKWHLPVHGYGWHGQGRADDPASRNRYADRQTERQRCSGTVSAQHGRQERKGHRLSQPARIRTRLCELSCSRLGLAAAEEIVEQLPSSDNSAASQALRTCFRGGTAFHTTNL